MEVALLVVVLVVLALVGRKLAGFGDRLGSIEKGVYADQGDLARERDEQLHARLDGLSQGLESLRAGVEQQVQRPEIGPVELLRPLQAQLQQLQTELTALDERWRSWEAVQHKGHQRSRPEQVEHLVQARLRIEGCDSVRLLDPLEGRDAGDVTVAFEAQRRGVRVVGRAHVEGDEVTSLDWEDSFPSFP